MHRTSFAKKKNPFLPEAGRTLGERRWRKSAGDALSFSDQGGGGSGSTEAGRGKVAGGCPIINQLPL